MHESLLSLPAHETPLHRYCRWLLDGPKGASAFASLQYMLLRPLSMLVEIITLKVRNRLQEGCCNVGEHAEVVGPTVDQVHWAFGEVQQYFDEGVIRCSEHMTVLDVGAHIGLFALEVMRRTSSTARLFCFEPLPRTSGFLRRNVRRFDARVQPRVFACGAGRAHAHMVMGEARVLSTSSYCNGGAGPFHASAADAEAQAFDDCIAPELCKLRGLGPVAWPLRFLLSALFRVITTTNGTTSLRSGTTEYLCEIRPLSSVIDAYGLEKIDVLKVDVEGAELDVLLGIADAHWPRIHTLALEVHDVDGRLERIEELLRSHGISHIEKRGGELAHREHPLWVVLARREAS